jgi:hypothetical protein
MNIILSFLVATGTMERLSVSGEHKRCSLYHGFTPMLEIVLRGGNGRFYGASQLISVFCHEVCLNHHYDLIDLTNLS